MGAARPAPWRYPDRPPGVVFDVSFRPKEESRPGTPAGTTPVCRDVPACRINRIPNRAAGTTGASGGGDRVSDGVLKLGQDALSTSHYHDRWWLVDSACGRVHRGRERHAGRARNTTPKRATAARPARRARAPPRGAAAGRRRRRYAPEAPRNGGQTPLAPLGPARRSDTRHHGSRAQYDPVPQYGGVARAARSRSAEGGRRRAAPAEERARGT